MSEKLKARTPTTNEIGALIRDLREQRNVSQSQLGKLIDKRNGHSYISRIEAGNRKPSKIYLERIATALHLTTEEQAFLLRTGGYASEAPAYSEDFAKLHQMLINPLLGKQVRKSILKQILALSELAESAIAIERERLAVDRAASGSKGNP